MPYEPPAKNRNMALSIVSALDTVGIACIPAFAESYPGWLLFYATASPYDVEDALLRLKILKSPEVYEFEMDIDQALIPPPSGTNAFAVRIEDISIPRKYIRQ